MHKSYAILLAVIAIGLGAVIYAETNTISALNETITALHAKEAALHAQAVRDAEEIKKLQDQIAAYKSESDALRTKLAGGAGVEPAGGTPDANAAVPPAGNTKGAWMKGLAKMFTDPNMKKSMKAQQSMGIRMMYGDLFKKLGLSPQDSEQLADILAERQMEISAAAMSAMTNDGKPDPAQSQKITDAKQHYDDQLKATLGDANYKQLQDYEKTIGDRFLMQQYEGQFATAGAPLEPAQREALLNIMQEERSKLPESPFNQNGANPQEQLDALGNPVAVDQYFAQQEELNRRVLDRARQTFSPDQIAALQKIQQQTMELMRGQMKMSQELLGK